MAVSKKFYAYEEIERTEDGRWYGSLEYPYYDDWSGCISYFGDTKQELYEAQKHFKKASSYEEWENL